MELNETEKLDQVWSKLEITDCIHRWTRGADRIDIEVMRSAFHPGANINYGYSNGPVEEFLPWVVKFHSEDLVTTSHMIFNLIIELDGDRARSEAGVDCKLRYRDPDGLADLLVMGRYLDNWERRDQGWRIADRTAMLDSYRTVRVEQSSHVDPWITGPAYGQHSLEDISYKYIHRRA